MLAKFSGLKLSLEKEKENFCVVLTHSTKRASEIGKFHGAVVQQRLRNVQKSVMQEQSSSFANLNLWTRNFATIVTWRPTSPLYIAPLLLTSQGPCWWSKTKAFPSYED